MLPKLLTVLAWAAVGVIAGLGIGGALGAISSMNIMYQTFTIGSIFNTTTFALMGALGAAGAAFGGYKAITDNSTQGMGFSATEKDDSRKKIEDAREQSKNNEAEVALATPATNESNLNTMPQNNLTNWNLLNMPNTDKEKDNKENENNLSSWNIFSSKERGVNHS